MSLKWASRWKALEQCLSHNEPRGNGLQELLTDFAGGSAPPTSELALFPLTPLSLHPGSLSDQGSRHRSGTMAQFSEDDFKNHLSVPVRTHCTCSFVSPQSRLRRNGWGFLPGCRIEHPRRLGQGEWSGTKKPRKQKESEMGPPAAPLQPPKRPPACGCAFCFSGLTNDPGLYCVAAKYTSPNRGRGGEKRMQDHLVRTLQWWLHWYLVTIWFC